MGRFVIEYVIPASISMWIVWSGLKFWYYRVFPKNIETMKDLSKTGDKYDAKINK